MAKFDARIAVEAMEFDFTAYNGDKGIIPEPTQGQVEKFFEKIGDVKKLAQRLEVGFKEAQSEGLDALDEFVANLPEDKLRELQAEMSGWAAAVCSGFPTREDIEKLPYRVFGAFFRFLAEELGPKDQPA